MIKLNNAIMLSESIDDGIGGGRRSSSNGGDGPTGGYSSGSRVDLCAATASCNGGVMRTTTPQRRESLSLEDFRTLSRLLAAPLRPAEEEESLSPPPPPRPPPRPCRGHDHRDRDRDQAHSL